MTYKSIGLRNVPARKAARRGPLTRVGHALGRGIKVYLMLVLAAIVGGGCASPNHFEKSPCACHFDDINTLHEG